ncbi:MAG: hypothetical protein QGI11_10160, partial [Nitrospinota bacterium]|nr:hypothetical protein [Nitrospinota bacterium]
MSLKTLIQGKIPTVESVEGQLVRITKDSSLVKAQAKDGLIVYVITNALVPPPPEEEGESKESETEKALMEFLMKKESPAGVDAKIIIGERESPSEAKPPVEKTSSPEVKAPGPAEKEPERKYGQKPEPTSETLEEGARTAKPEKEGPKASPAETEKPEEPRESTSPQGGRESGEKTEVTKESIGLPEDHSARTEISPEKPTGEIETEKATGEPVVEKQIETPMEIPVEKVLTERAAEEEAQRKAAAERAAKEEAAKEISDKARIEQAIREILEDEEKNPEPRPEQPETEESVSEEERPGRGNEKPEEPGELSPEAT